MTFLRYRLRRLEVERTGNPRLAETVESLRRDMADLRAAHSAELAELNERLGFAERLLTKGRAVDSPE